MGAQIFAVTFVTIVTPKAKKNCTLPYSPKMREKFYRFIPLIHSASTINKY